MDVLTVTVDGKPQHGDLNMLVGCMKCATCGEPALECGNPDDCMAHVEEGDWVVVEIEVECEECDGLGWVSGLCSACSGSGEGMWDGSTCRACRGSGESRGECQECDGDGHVFREQPVFIALPRKEQAQ